MVYQDNRFILSILGAVLGGIGEAMQIVTEKGLMEL